VTDAGLKQLSGWTNLERLTVTTTPDMDKSVNRTPLP
jgi:hypothetical protein